jgi:hypothetical protein
MHLRARVGLKLGILVTGVLLLAPVPARAVLIDLGNSTVDTDTGLEWLDLTLTDGLSFNDALGTNFVLVDGYQHATAAQVNTLWLNANFSDVVAGFQAVDAGPAALLLDLLGCTSSDAGNNSCNVGRFPESSGLTPNSATFAREYRFVAQLDADVSIPTANAIAGDAAASAFVGVDVGQDGVGNYLVRNFVPEPATGLLLALGALGIAAARRGN